MKKHTAKKISAWREEVYVLFRNIFLDMMVYNHFLLIIWIYTCILMQLNVTNGHFSPKHDTSDQKHMLRALELAANAQGQASPNPCVGCVITDSSGQVVGEGWHVRAGEAHAEVVALEQAGEAATRGTAYVSLEPCNHYGRTGPCTHAIVKSGISRVVVGMVDPDPRVSGGGIQYLKEHGVEVEVGVKEDECKALNAAFIFRLLKARPLVTLWTALVDESGDNSGGKTTTSAPSMLDCSQVLSACPDVDTIIIPQSELVSMFSSGLLRALPDHIRVAVLCKDQSEEEIDLLRSRIAALNNGARRWTLLYGSSRTNTEDVVVAAMEDEPMIKALPVGAIGEDFDACSAQLAAHGCNSALALSSSDDELLRLTQNSAVQRCIITSSAKTGRGAVFRQMQSFRHTLRRALSGEGVDRLASDDCIKEVTLSPEGKGADTGTDADIGVFQLTTWGPT